MGYGHQRAAYPFRDIAYTHILNANSDKLLSEKEAHMWQKYRVFYESVSRLTGIPIIGKMLFNLYDRMQAISEMYPQRDLSKPSFQSRHCNYLITKKKLNYSMFSKMKENKLPVITTFFFTALAAENAGVEKVYCIATDSDINRVWVANNPSTSKIVYFAPTDIVAKRLKLYGVSDDRIILTGFPLPQENIGGEKMSVLKKDLGIRLANLDPKKKLPDFYTKILKEVVGSKNYKKSAGRPLTLTFAVGGAGAQTEIGYQVLKSLKEKILKKEVKINIAVGTRPHVNEYFKNSLKELKLDHGKHVSIIFAWNKTEYFKNFNQAIRSTDLLWTKPSELSFYCGLGIPIIIAPPIGSHEYRNQSWLINMGSGVNQEKPEYTHEWLFDMLNSGKLAEAALQGFVQAPKLGTYEIEKIVLGKKK
jgi:hypothetical protein